MLVSQRTAAAVKHFQPFQVRITYSMDSLSTLVNGGCNMTITSTSFPMDYYKLNVQQYIVYVPQNIVKISHK
jgi:hypothetical protein